MEPPHVVLSPMLCHTCAHMFFSPLSDTTRDCHIHHYCTTIIERFKRCFSKFVYFFSWTLNFQDWWNIDNPEMYISQFDFLSRMCTVALKCHGKNSMYANSIQIAFFHNHVLKNGDIDIHIFDLTLIQAYSIRHRDVHSYSRMAKNMLCIVSSWVKSD